MIRDVICQLKNQDTQLYNYIASHNGFTLCDVVSYDGKHNEANGENNLDGPDYNYSWNCGAEGNSRKKAVNELRKNQIFNAFFLLLFAQGMPCILSGDEFMNTQKGNNNAYCQDNLISWLDWNQLSRQEELYTFVCRLIALRKACMKQIAKKSEDTMGRSGIPQISYRWGGCVANGRQGVQAGSLVYSIMKKVQRRTFILHIICTGFRIHLHFLPFQKEWNGCA